MEDKEDATASPTERPSMESHSSESSTSESYESLASSISSSKGSIMNVPLSELTCDEMRIKSDECLKEALFIGQEKADIPKEEEDMDEYCVIKKENFNCIKEWGSRCLKNVPRQLYMTIIKNVRKMFKEFCDTRPGKMSKY